MSEEGETDLFWCRPPKPEPNCGLPCERSIRFKEVIKKKITECAMEYQASLAASCVNVKFCYQSDFYQAKNKLRSISPGTGALWSK